MAFIDTVTLTIEVPNLGTPPFVNLEDLLNSNQATISVACDIYFDPREVADENTFTGRIEIHGGGGSRRRKLFDMTWLEFHDRIPLLPIMWPSFQVSAAEFPNHEPMVILRPNNVLLSRLDEDPSFEIRFADSVPDDFALPARRPNPDFPFPPPLGLPSFPIRDEAIDQITARVVLDSNAFDSTTTRDSNTVAERF